MKSLYITLLVLCIVCTVKSVRYKTEDSYDYDYEYSEYKQKSHPERDEELDLMKPQYNLKDGPQLFENFVITYNKVYKDNADKMYHYQVFLKNLEKIIRINKESKTQSADINQFADLDQSQLAAFIG